MAKYSYKPYWYGSYLAIYNCVACVHHWQSVGTDHKLRPIIYNLGTIIYINVYFAPNYVDNAIHHSNCLQRHFIDLNNSPLALYHMNSQVLQLYCIVLYQSRGWGPRLAYDPRLNNAILYHIMCWCFSKFKEGPGPHPLRIK